MTGSECQNLVDQNIRYESYPNPGTELDGAFSSGASAGFFYDRFLSIQFRAFFFLEYAKDLRIIAFKKKKYLSYKRRASSALGGLTSGPT
jgi:hypothetical protein